MSTVTTNFTYAQLGAAPYGELINGDISPVYPYPVINRKDLPTDFFYLINPDYNNIVEVLDQPIIVQISGSWSGFRVTWQSSNDRSNWSNFLLSGLPGFRTWASNRLPPPTRWNSSILFQNNFSFGFLRGDWNGEMKTFPMPLDGIRDRELARFETYSGHLPVGHRYLRIARKPVLFGSTYQPEFTRRVAPQSGNPFVSLTYVSTDISQDCEYFNGSILKIEQPQGLNELNINVPYIIWSGISGYNIIQNVLNTPTGSSSIVQYFYDGNNYEFEVKAKLVSGEITYIEGNVLLLNPDLPQFFNVTPEPIGGFYLESSGQNYDLVFISNTEGTLYNINSSTINQSTTYRTNNVLHICGGDI